MLMPTRRSRTRALLSVVLLPLACALVMGSLIVRRDPAPTPSAPPQPRPASASTAPRTVPATPTDTVIGSR